MKASVIVLAFSVGLIAIGNAAEHGMIRICRTPGNINDTDHKTIPISMGTHFVTSPSFTDSEGGLKSIEVQTVADTKILANAKCTSVEAELIGNDTGQKVTPKSHFLRMSAEGYTPDVNAYISSDFK
jgi:hypothetical protein